jgi:hypothetical protein
VTSIGTSAFSGCSSLTNVEVLSTSPPSLSYTAFNGVPLSATLTVPSGSKAAYQSAGSWRNFGAIVEKP